MEEYIGKKCKYLDHIGLPKEGIIAYIEFFGSQGNAYVYIKSEYEGENPYKTTLDGTVPEFEYCDVRLSELVEVVDE